MPDEDVRDYINPHITNESHNGSVFRAHRYGPDYFPQFEILLES